MIMTLAILFNFSITKNFQIQVKKWLNDPHLASPRPKLQGLGLRLNSSVQVVQGLLLEIEIDPA